MSGYDSNPEKVRFFSVPKNELSKWLCTIPRKNFILKAGDRVCSKHFVSEDILWKSEILAADGVTILGVSIIPNNIS